MKRPRKPPPDPVIPPREEPDITVMRPPRARETTLTWLGEDHLHDGGHGPRFNVWNGIKFEVGVPTSIAGVTPEVRAHMLRKAGPPFWKVDHGDGHEA